MSRRVAILAAFGLVAPAILPPFPGGARPVVTSIAGPEAIHPTIAVTVTGTGKTAHTFQVEVARTPAEQERGLMFRRSLPSDGGMLFPIDPATMASFWMKNTPLPLDILFIRSDGTVSRIHPNARPFSLDPIDSEGPVVAVLEIAGGRAAKLGLRAGDRVSWQEQGQTADP